LVVLLCPSLGAVGCSPVTEESSPGSSEESRVADSRLQGRQVDPPVSAPAFAPSLTVGEQEIFLSWLEKRDGDDDSVSHRLRFSKLTGGVWSTPSTIAEGANFFANWADIPKVIQSSGGTLFAHWLAKTAKDTYAYSINMARSGDAGVSWQKLGTLNDDSSPTEHGFVSYVREGAGVRAFWLDGRAMVNDGGSMALRTAYVHERIESSELLDKRVCDCCSTDAAIVRGMPTVVFRDRSPEEIRDISVIQGSIRAAGAKPDDLAPHAAKFQWSDSSPVSEDGWEIAGCPVNGPEIAVDDDSTAVAWFTGSGDEPKVAVAFSSGNGIDFGEPVVIDADVPLGRVDVIMAGTDTAVVSWLASNQDQAAEVRLQSVSSDGRVGDPRVVARTSASRAAGVPKMVRSGQIVYIAWVETGAEDGSKIRVREVELSALTLGENKSS
jgi:hypothetical protein